MARFGWKNACPPYLNYAYFHKPGRVSDHAYLIDIATLAYADPEFAVPVLEKAGFYRIRFHSKDGTQCYTADKDGQSVIAFRGTQSNIFIDASHSYEVLLDFWSDLKANFIKFGGVHVHAGFWKALQPVLEDIERSTMNRNVWITGHSLGAALATLAAFAHAQPQLVGSLVTFGSPKVGDSNFAAILEHRIGGRIVRYTHGRDGVPLVPFSSMGYEHVGTNIHLGPKKTSHPGMFKRGCLPLPKSILPLPGWIHDHVPVLYADHIWEKHKESKS